MHDEIRKKAFVVEVAKTMRNDAINWNVRQKFWKEKNAEWDTIWGGKIDILLFDCPEMFGPFKVSKWGGFGRCGFDIWFDENGKREKRWIDINNLYNIIFKIDDGEKNNIVQKLNPWKRTPECLTTLFPDGYYLSKDATEKVSGPVAVAPVVVAPVTTEVAPVTTEVTTEVAPEVTKEVSTEVAPVPVTPEQIVPEVSPVTTEVAPEVTKEVSTEVSPVTTEVSPEVVVPEVTKEVSTEVAPVTTEVAQGGYRKRTHRRKNKTKRKNRKSKSSKKYTKSKKNSKKHKKSKRSKK
jgi:hypothetical protein